MNIVLWIWGIGLLVVGVWLTRDPGFFGNVGFLIVGALAGIYPVFLIEEIRRAREAKNLAKALFHELANRVGRCCFDFEAPWAALYQRPTEMDIMRLNRFAPDRPIIYPAVAPQIGLLPDDVAKAVIDFYVALSAWERDVESTVDEFSGRGQVAIGSVQRLGRRLRMTLEPGLRALQALGARVPGAVEIEKKALEIPDRLFAKEHPNAGKPVRERIGVALDATERHH